MVADDDDDWIATDAKSVLGPAYVAAREARIARDGAEVGHATDQPKAAAPVRSPLRQQSVRPAVEPTPIPAPSAPPVEHPSTLLQRIEQGQRERAELGQVEAVASTPGCTEHPDCGPFTRDGFSGHGHGPSPTTGLWCWHFHPNWLGDPGEIAPEGSDLAARRAQQAQFYDGDPFVHKTYPTDR